MKQRGINTQRADKACAQLHTRDEMLKCSLKLFYQKESKNGCVLRMHGRVQPTKKENGRLGSSHTERLNQSWFLDSNVSPGVKISACSTKIPSTSLQCWTECCLQKHCIPESLRVEESFTFTHRVNSCNWASRRIWQGANWLTGTKGGNNARKL